MGFGKKTGKGRLDKYYFLAKDQGYRARSAFKLIQLHNKYNLLDQARVVIDLCAAPGGWLQVATRYMPASNVIVGVDLVPIKPIPGVKTIVADITTDRCRSELKKELKNWKADVVLHDGAPNVGKAWLHDAYGQAELVLHSLRLATEFLIQDGSFVTKVFRSREYNALIWVFNQLFNKVEATKPASSRSVSAEIFVICRGFKSPNFIDPRLLDPKHVFEDIGCLQNKVIKTDLLHPQKTTRHREGYEDGTTILFKSITADDFIRSHEPNTILATYNQITFPSGTTRALTDLANETAEILALCSDLKVLGRREFKILSNWRKHARAELCLDAIGQSEAGESSEKIPTEDNPLEELNNLSKKLSKLEKREKRKALERKAKQRMRMQLGMGNTEDLAEEVAEHEGLFSLKKPIPIINVSWDDSDGEQNETHKVDESNIVTLSEDSEELWESEFEEQYERTKVSRKERQLVEPKPLTISDEVGSASDNDSIMTEASINEDDLEKSLLTKEEELAEQEAKTALWYSNPLFKELENAPIPESSKKKLKKEKKRKISKDPQEGKPIDKKKNPEPGEIVFVKPDSYSADEIDESTKEALLTPSGMTLASRIAKDKERAKKDLIDDSFNRYAFNGDAHIPRWFLDEEKNHNRPQKPITKEGVALLKAKLHELSVRPIKKEIEAKGRNRQRMVRKLEQMKKKAEIIADSDDIGERQKSEQIQKLLNKAKKSQKKEKKLVIAKGRNKRIKGRPRGVKGHYKMVDRRMKKEVKALSRIKARNTGERYRRK